VSNAGTSQTGDDKLVLGSIQTIIFHRSDAIGARKIMSSLKKEKMMGNLDFLKEVDIFSDLNADELAEIDKIATEKEYRGQEVVFKENDPGDKIYIVAQGQVEVKKGLQLYTGPTRVSIATIPEKEVFGELAVFDEGQRSAEVIASAGTKLLIIEKSAITQLFEKNTALATKVLIQIIKRISQRLRKSDEVIRNLSVLLKTLQSPL
jgi:CRP-like cAMP-binding protein